MAECHVIAYVQANGEVTTHRSGTHPGFANTVHHASIRATDNLTVIIWWRDRLSPTEEKKHNNAVAESIKEEFDRRR
jgi:hypothetical protein